MRIPFKDISARGLISMVTAVAMLAVASCGGPGGSTNTTPTTPTAASLQLLVSSGNLLADGSSTVALTAQVKDGNNNALADQVVTFKSDAGSISVDNAGKTDKNGLATATLSTLGDKSTRTINLTATLGTLTAKNTVQATGSKVSISGVNSVVTGNTTQLTIRVQDGAGKAVPQQAVTLKSSLNNTFTVGGQAATTVTTDSSGQATVTYTATNAGVDQLSASALNETGALTVNVSSDQFTIATSQPEIALNTPLVVSATFKRNGVAQTNQTITFSATRGTLSSATAQTDANGVASITVTSTNSGKSTITASIGSTTAQQTVEFVATSPDPAKSIIQAEKTTVTPKGSTSITATVRDTQGNLVKNQTVNFSLTDVTGGALSVASGVTDSFGQTTTTYTAGNVSSARDAVKITASINGTVINGGTPLSLTVAGQSVFVRLGTGNTITVLNSTQYQIPYAVLVTDAAGNPVVGAQVQIQLQPYQGTWAYRKGFWYVDAITNLWTQQINDQCRNEDRNLNGILEAGEDDNNNGLLEPGTVAAASPASVTTDNTGSAFVAVTYGKNYGNWTMVSLTAKTTVQGSEYQNSADFILPLLGDDLKDTKTSPPGQTSPFGVNKCNVPN